MQKEIVITIIIITFIIMGNIVTQNNTKNAVEIMSMRLDSIKEEILPKNKNEENLKEKLDLIEKTWEEKYKTLAYYIEHEELEKVETEITKLRANLFTKEYEVAVENIDTCNFILTHIKDKSALKIVNIF